MKYNKLNENKSSTTTTVSIPADGELEPINTRYCDNEDEEEEEDEEAKNDVKNDEHTFFART